MKILFLGPCRKQDRRTGALHRPFDPKTLSGGYVALVQRALEGVATEFHFSNIIDGAHLVGAERNEKNPDAADLVAHWRQFERRIARMDVDWVVAFGSNVRDAFARVDKVDYQNGYIYCRGNLRIVFALHPSFVMVYRRKKKNKYIASLSRLILGHANFHQDFSGA